MLKKDIDKGIIFNENNHHNIVSIRKNAPKNNFDFDFKQTNTDTITKQYEPNLCQS
jgi:hypothetical protein